VTLTSSACVALLVLLVGPAFLLVGCAADVPPSLVIRCLSRVAAGEPVALAWPGVEPLVGADPGAPLGLPPTALLVVEPGEKLRLTLRGASSPPGKTRVDILAVGQDGRPGESLASGELDRSAWESSWEGPLLSVPLPVQLEQDITVTVTPGERPDRPILPEEGTPLLLRVESRWLSATGGQTRRAVTYLAGLVLVPRGTIRLSWADDDTGAVRAAQRFFDAMWKGNKDLVRALLDPGSPASTTGSAARPRSFLSVDRSCPWDLILWQREGCPGETVFMAAEPAFLLVRQADGDTPAEVVATFVLTVRGAPASPGPGDPGAGKPQHTQAYTFTERYLLRPTSDGLRVVEFYRDGTPVLSGG